MDDPRDAPEVSKAQIVKHSISIAGHRTSISLERQFWDLLRDAAAARHLSINELVSEIDREREGNLSSAVRLYILDELIRKTTSDT
jgi:predicted DNA-binding ribbon-helix-helix protein|tara:strand:+ start:505 stop:762 length:258 start_codon:yes stop_codon:yes gene_type:complete